MLNAQFSLEKLYANDIGALREQDHIHVRPRDGNG
jgi:hypothetical protein